jgi:formylglycine-generating enzyme required for sulfatase activity
LATAYSFGDKIAPKDLNYYDSNVGTPVAVGSYKPNSFGLYDMHGNVWEWCEDWHAVYNVEAVTDPVGPATGEFRILRGGSFLSYVSEGRSAARHTFGQSFRIADYGFRLAKTK